MGNCEHRAQNDVGSQLTSGYIKRDGFKDVQPMPRIEGDFSNEKIDIDIRVDEVEMPKIQEFRSQPPKSRRPLALPILSLQLLQTLQGLNKLQYDDVKRGQIFSRMYYYGTRHIYEGEADLLRQTVVPQGQGSIYFTDGSLFQGTFQEGKAEGRCRLISSNGSVYEGIIKNGIIQGYGKCQDEQGQYEGEMLSGVPHGQGSYKNEQSNYQGNFTNGQKTTGTYAWNNNQYVYTGSFQNQKFEGNGVLVEPEGRYQGNFHEGYKEGYGVFTWTDGRRYEGQFFKSKLQGYGELYESDGNPVYKGHWLDNVPVGSGVRFVMENGKLKPHLTS